MKYLKLVVALAVCAYLAPALADAYQDRAAGAYLELGGTPFHGSDPASYSASAGVLLPWSPTPGFSQGAQSLYWDLFAGNWSAPAEAGGRSNFAQLGGILNWRYRFSQGLSPWFAELGFGASLMDRVYHTPQRQFSTTFQFTEVIGAGVSLGDHGQHEVALRLQHFSNAGIKEPNPGETFVRARYTYRF